MLLRCLTPDKVNFHKSSAQSCMNVPQLFLSEAEHPHLCHLQQVAGGTRTHRRQGVLLQASSPALLLPVCASVLILTTQDILTLALPSCLSAQTKTPSAGHGGEFFLKAIDFLPRGPARIMFLNVHSLTQVCITRALGILLPLRRTLKCCFQCQC